MKDRIDALENDEEDLELEDYANMLYDVALVNSGFLMKPEDTDAMSERLQRLVSVGLQIPENAEIEPMPEFAEDEDDEDDDEEDEDEDEEELEDTELDDEIHQNVSSEANEDAVHDEL